MNGNLIVEPKPIAHLYAACGGNGKYTDDTIEIDSAEQLKETMRNQRYQDCFKNIQKFPEVDFSQRKVLLIKDYDWKPKYDLLAYNGYSIEDQTLTVRCSLAAVETGDRITTGMDIYYNALFVSVPKGFTYKVEKKKKEYGYHLQGTQESSELTNKKYELKNKITTFESALFGFKLLQSKALNEDVANAELGDLKKSLADVEARIASIYSAIVLEKAGPSLRDLCKTA